MNMAEQRIPSGVLILIAGAIAVAAMIAAAMLLLGQHSTVSATGGGCTDADVPGIEGDPVASHDAGADIVTDVCIKAGTNMFDGGHSGKLGNGTFEDGCYQVSGVGTSTVTVERIGNDPPCQEISHIDVYTGPPAPTPTPTATPPAGATATPTPTSTVVGEVLGEVQGPQAELPQALPVSGGAPAGGSGSYFPLLLALGGLALLGGAGTFAVAAARRRR